LRNPLLHSEPTKAGEMIWKKEAMMYRPLGKFGQDAGVTPLFVQKTSWDFLV